MTEWKIWTYTATYHTGNAEQMSERVNYAHERVIADMVKSGEGYQPYQFTTSTVGCDEIGRTTVCLIAVREKTP